MKKAYVVMLISAAATGFASAASSEAKLAYNSAYELAAADFNVARGQCDSVSGTPKQLCLAVAKAARVRTEANAKAQYKNTLSARTVARKQIAEADFVVDKLRCASQSGNAQDVCVKQAQATLVDSVADAKADKAVIEARSSAREDKSNAEFKVAEEKCGALAGPSREACVAAAKAQYGK